MAQLAAYIDVTSNSFISGLNLPQKIAASSLPLFFGDTLSLQIYLLQPLQTQNPANFNFDILDTAGLALYVYLDDGTVGGTIYTQQIIWETDADNQYFYANLALNTAALQTLLGTKTSAPAWLKIGYVQNGLVTTVLSQQVTIGVGLPTTELVVPAGLTPLSVEAARQMFFPLMPVPGLALQLESPDGKIIAQRAVDLPDGSAELNADPLN